MHTAQANSYFERINYSGAKNPSLSTLKQLQQAHLYTVPFENLDIHRNVPIDLNFDHIYKKVVAENRGGFCYELNGLFFQLLRYLNFEAHLISATVYGEEDGFGFPGSHCAIVVCLDAVNYLVDVGFGEFALWPLRLDTADCQRDPRGDFYVDKTEDGSFQVSKIDSDQKKIQYKFKNTARNFQYFKEGCRYHQTNPDSPFVQKALISLPHKNGRKTMAQHELKTTRDGKLDRHRIKNEKEFENLLWQLYKVDIPDAGRLFRSIA